MMNQPNTDPDKFMAAFEDFMLFLNQRAAEERGKSPLPASFTPIPPDVFTFDTGRKYIRVVRNYGTGAGTQKSVYCFVQLLSGLIWKPATWYGPSLNFSRSSLFCKDNPDAPGHTTWDRLSYWGL